MFPHIGGWTDVARTTRANVRLGAVLAFVAGALGFKYAGKYGGYGSTASLAVLLPVLLGVLTFRPVLEDLRRMARQRREA